MSDTKSNDAAHDAANEAMKVSAPSGPRKIDPTLHTALEWMIDHGVSLDDAANWMSRNDPKKYTVARATAALKAEL